MGVQVKASSHPRRPGNYVFSKTAGYHGLLVLCVALDERLLWALPGSQLNASGLSLTLRGKWDSYRCCWSGLSAVLVCAWMCQDAFRRSPLASLRAPLSPTQKTELLSLDVGGEMLKQVGLIAEAPRQQQGPVDTVVDGDSRVQSKARKATDGQVRSYTFGLFRKSSSTCRSLYLPGDFDALMAFLMVGDVVLGCFVIPTRELALRGFFCHTQRRASITLYLPWSRPTIAKAKAAKEWQAPFFVHAGGGFDEVEKGRLRKLMLDCRGGMEPRRGR